MKKLIKEMFESPVRGWLGPEKPRTANPGLHLPPGAYIPDYRQYKVESSPELMHIQKKLAARGLKSNWLRNEVWRYDRKLWGSRAWRNLDVITQGWRVAIPMLVVTAIYEFVLKKEDDHHGHGDHGHDKAHH